MERLYPTENMFRRRIGLDGIWQVSFDGVEASRETGAARKASVPVPGAWRDMFGDARPVGGTIRYERSAFVPAEYLGNDVFLRMDGVGVSAIIYVNGTEAGRHEGAFTAACIEVTKQLRYGEYNRIVVEVSTALSPTVMPGGGYVEGRDGAGRNETGFDGELPYGLYGPVCLYAVPQTRLTSIDIETEEANESVGRIRYAVAVQGNCLVTATLRDPERRVVATGVGGSGTLTVEQPELWHLGNGVLYAIEFEVSRLGKQHDSYTIYTGFRTVEHRTERGWFLNGAPVGLFIADLPAVYTANPVAERQALEVAIRAGANCIYSRRPMSEAMLDMADRLGVAVIQSAGTTYRAFADGNRFGRENILQAYAEAVKRCVEVSKLHTSVIGCELMSIEETPGEDCEAFVSAAAEAYASSQSGGRPIGLRMRGIPSFDLQAFGFVIADISAFESDRVIGDGGFEAYDAFVSYRAKTLRTGVLPVLALSADSARREAFAGESAERYVRIISSLASGFSCIQGYIVKNVEKLPFHIVSRHIKE